MNSTTTQPNLLELAKQGNAQAIAALMNRQLQPKGITVKVSLSGDCLMVVAESIEPPEQLFLVNFIRKGMTNLKIEAIKRVVVRGQATGNTARAWREAFDIHSDNFKKTIQTSSYTSSQAPIPSTSKPKFALGVLNKALNIIQNRKAERIALVAGTFLLTSMVWAGMGTLNPASKQAKSETQTKTLYSTQPPSEKVEPNEPNIVKEKFDVRVTKDIERLKVNLPQKIQQTNYQYWAEYAENYSVNIEKTDSIVTPFIGTAQYNIYWYANGKLVSSDMLIQATYAYQDGEWILKDAIRYVDGKPDRESASVGGPAWASALFN